MRYAEEVNYSRIDALFLSHFHADHVNGLNQLLALCGVDCVVVPYMSPEERLLQLTREMARGSLDADLLKLFCEPTTWFGDKGVKRIVYILPDGNPDSREKQWEDDPAKLDTGTESGKPDDPSNPWDSIALGIAPHVLSSYPGCIVQVASCLEEILIVVPLLFGSFTWRFLTYVFPEDSKTALFKSEVDRYFPGLLPSTKFELDYKALVAILQDLESRNLLRSCYRAISTNHNETCLSLYSGAVGHEEWARRRFIGRDVNGSQSTCMTGWLGTGDSPLSSTDRITRFCQHFSSLRSTIQTLTLPHHGSRKDWHPNLKHYALDFIASARTNNEHHPHYEVQRACGPERLLVTTEIIDTVVHDEFTSIERNQHIDRRLSASCEGLRQLKDCREPQALE